MEHPFVGYRKNHGITQAKLGEMLGITQGMVGHIENGRRAITPENAIEWEKRTGISRGDLCPEIFSPRDEAKAA